MLSRNKELWMDSFCQLGLIRQHEFRWIDSLAYYQGASYVSSRGAIAQCKAKDPRFKF